MNEAARRIRTTHNAKYADRVSIAAEMKGSWFIWGKYRAHEDWCRWRAPFWHGTRVTDSHSHANYHLGFRCCSTLSAK